MTMHRYVALLVAAFAIGAVHAGVALAQSDAGWDEDNPEALLEITIESRGSGQWRRYDGEPVSVRIHRTLSAEFALRGAYASTDLVGQIQSPSAAVAAATPSAAEMEVYRQIQACGSDTACAQRLAMQAVALQQQRMQGGGAPLSYLVWSPSSTGDNGCVVRWSESVNDEKTESVMVDVPGRGMVRTQRTTTIRAAAQSPSHAIPACHAPPLATATRDSSWTLGLAYIASLGAEAEVTVRDVTTRTTREAVGLVAPVHPEALVIRGTGVPRGSVTLQGVVREDDQEIPVEVRVTWAAKNIVDVRAEPGGPYRVARGEVVTLDGSQSRGAGLRYEWSFAPNGCPPGVEINREARLSGPRPQVTLLCTTEATLTVTDGRQSDSRSVTVEVAPRDWRTPFQHVAEEGLLNAASPSIRRTSRAGDSEVTFEGRFVGGENVSASDPSRNANETLEPFAVNGTWENLGYTLAQVGDGGPFNGVWYVGDYRIEVKRKTLINKYLVPNGTEMRAGSFHGENVRRGTEIEAFLTAIRAHEGMRDADGVLGHSGLIEKALRQQDPALRVEPLMGQARETLREQVDGLLREGDSYICRESQDPLPVIWRGRVAFPYDDMSGWETVTLTTGGGNYGHMAACR